MPLLRSGSKTLLSQNSQTPSTTTTSAHDPLLNTITSTISQIPTIISTTPEASNNSTFSITQTAPLPALKNAKPTCSPIQVIHAKPISWLIEFISKPEYTSKVLFVNHTSPDSPGGLVALNTDSSELSEDTFKHKTTPEHLLLAVSTLHLTLSRHEKSYPWPSFKPAPSSNSRNHEKVTCPTVVSPNVVIFKSPSDFSELPESQRALVSVVSIESPRGVTEDNVDVIIELGYKIITILRVAGTLGKRVVVFGDFGCSSSKSDVSQSEKRKQGKKKSGKKSAKGKELENDPAQVAELVHYIVMTDNEFLGRFDEIILVAEDEEIYQRFLEVVLLQDLGVNLGVGG